MNKKILDYFLIDGLPGGNQDDLIEWDMNKGGCGAITACDVCMFLARHEKYRKLYPYNINNLTKNDFINFATNIMKPFLSPRYHGIDFLETYICGFNDYFRNVNVDSLMLEGLSGNVDYEIFENAVIDQINRNFPVPYLMLMHKDKILDDFNWHWFNLAGYERKDNSELDVLTVTYGEYQWFSLKNMWNTGHKRKGGIIRIFERDK